MVLPCAVQCLLGSLDICFIEFFWCQATKIKLVTAKVWPKGGPKNGSVLRPQKWPRENKYIFLLMIPGGPTFGVTKRLQKWPRYFAHKDLQRGAETDASSIEVRDTAYRTQAATKRTREDLSMADGFGFDFRRRKLYRN